MTQNLNQIEALELDEFRVVQVALTEIEERVNLQVADKVREGDTFTVPEAIGDRQPFEHPSDIQW